MNVRIGRTTPFYGVLTVMLFAAAAAIGSPSEPAVEPGTAQLMPRDWALQIWTLITFFVVLAILSRFAYRPLQDMLNRRDAAIRDSLDRADEARRQSEQLAADQAEEYRNAKDEARAIMAQSRAMSQQVQKEAESEARKHAAEIVEAARSQIENEVRTKVNELRETVATLSIRVARQVVKENIDEKRHDELVDQFMDRIRRNREGESQPG